MIPQRAAGPRQIRIPSVFGHRVRGLRGLQAEPGRLHALHAVTLPALSMVRQEATAENRPSVLVAMSLQCTYRSTPALVLTSVRDCVSTPSASPVRSPEGLVPDA